MQAHLSTRALITTATTTAFLATILPADAGDDFGFIAGKYAVSESDCEHVAKGMPFSKDLVSQIYGEVLTPEGITSHRETHCRFQSATKAAEAKWTVQAQCEELGVPSQDVLEIAAGPEGSLIVTSEDIFGPPLTFLLCPK